MSDLKYHLGKYLKDHNMLQKDFAKLIGVQPNTLSQWVNDKRQPDNETWIKLSSTLQVPIDQLMGAPTAIKRVPTEQEIKVAFFGGEQEISDEMWTDMKQYAEFLKLKYKK